MMKQLMSGFDDAVAQVTAIRDRFGHGHSAVCLDDLWYVCDLTVFSDPQRHNHSSALDWACCAILNDARIHKLVLLSSVTRDVSEVSEDDIAEYRLMRTAFAGHGVEFVDWILYDGETYRSRAFTVEARTTWGGRLASEAETDAEARD